MIAPVTDIGPGVIWLRPLPIHPISRNAIRVVTVRSRGTHKLADNMFYVAGGRGGQCFPILKDVTPITRV